MSWRQMTRTPELGCYFAIKVAWPLWLVRLVSNTDSVSLPCTNVQVCHMVHTSRLVDVYSGDLNPSHLAPNKGPAEVMNPYEYVMGTWLPFKV